MYYNSQRAAASFLVILVIVVLKAPAEGVEGNAETSVEGSQPISCAVSKVLIAMKDHLKAMETQIQHLRLEVKQTCHGGPPSANATDEDLSDELDTNETLSSELDAVMNETFGDVINGDKEEGVDGDVDLDSMEGDHNATMESENATSTEDSTPTLPPPPTECAHPFRLVASSCYYILFSQNDWRTWGEANAFCQTVNGTLAAPWRLGELQSYLAFSISNVVWVGARYHEEEDETKWLWLTGRPVENKEWKEGHPSTEGSKHCVYLEAWSKYKAVDYYCGEKFPFVCEMRSTN